MASQNHSLQGTVVGNSRVPGFCLRFLRSQLDTATVYMQTHLDMVVAFGEKGVGIFIPTWAKCFSMLSRLSLDDVAVSVSPHKHMHSEGQTFVAELLPGS